MELMKLKIIYKEVNGKNFKQGTSGGIWQTEY